MYGRNQIRNDSEKGETTGRLINVGLFLVILTALPISPGISNVNACVVSNPRAESIISASPSTSDFHSRYLETNTITLTGQDFKK